MITFPGSFKQNMQFKDCTQIVRNGCKIWICAKCKNHEQGHCNDVYDCKEIIYDDELSSEGQLQGGNTQCGCYSKEHGTKLRGDYNGI